MITGEIPFWEWMGGEQGLTHVWTAGLLQDIVAKLLIKTPVDVVMFDQAVGSLGTTSSVVLSVSLSHGVESGREGATHPGASCWMGGTSAVL